MKRLPSLHFCHTLYSYVGKRLPSTMSSQLKKVIVMCTSALWHGLYPGDAACLPAAVAACSHSAVFRTPHPKLPHVIFHAPLPPPAGYYCTFLLASFWSEAEKKLFAAVAPVSKVRRGLARRARATYQRCDALLQLLPKAVAKAVAVVWTILLLNYMTVGLLRCFFCTPLQLESTAIPCCWKN